MSIFENWIKLRNGSDNKYGEKICYCGHTDMCECSNPDKTLFDDSVKRGVLNPDDPKNGWNKMGLSKDEKAIMECYRILFYKSTPSADFEKLMDDAELNEEGQKLIDFMAHEIDEDLYNSIVDSVIKKYKFTGFKKQQFKTTIASCSPKFKKTI